MVARTPAPTPETPATPRSVGDAADLDRAVESQIRRLVDLGGQAPTAVTASRAVRPPVVVANKRLVSDGFGEAYLVWQCLDCGTIGSLDALPTRCVCGARREDLVYVVED